jgi:hypothetical protein
MYRIRQLDNLDNLIRQFSDFFFTIDSYNDSFMRVGRMNSEGHSVSLPPIQSFRVKSSGE